MQASSTSRIVKLPPVIISKIRTGVTIQDFSHAVSECIANSIDANAQRIVVRVNTTNAGFSVEDDGEGILPSDMHNVALRFYTSKHHSHGPNFNATHGFRGESLASISQVSTLQIISRAVGQFETYCKLLKGGMLQKIGPHTSRTPTSGTCVNVKDFLYNQPIRRKFELSEKTVSLVALITDSVLKLCLPYIDRYFTVIDSSSNSILLELSQGRTVSLTLNSALAYPVNAISCEECSEGDITVRLWLVCPEIESPYATENSSAMQYMYLNKHLSRIPALHDLLQSSFSQRLQQQLGKNDPVTRKSCYQKQAIYCCEITCPLSGVYTFQDGDFLPAACIRTVISLSQKIIARVWGLSFPSSKMKEQSTLERAQNLHGSALGAALPKDIWQNGLSELKTNHNDSQPQSQRRSLAAVAERKDVQNEAKEEPLGRTNMEECIQQFGGSPGSELQPSLLTIQLDDVWESPSAEHKGRVSANPHLESAEEETVSPMLHRKNVVKGKNWKHTGQALPTTAFEVEDEDLASPLVCRTNLALGNNRQHRGKGLETSELELADENTASPLVCQQNLAIGNAREVLMPRRAVVDAFEGLTPLFEMHQQGTKTACLEDSSAATSPIDFGISPVPPAAFQSFEFDDSFYWGVSPDNSCESFPMLDSGTVLAFVPSVERTERRQVSDNDGLILSPTLDSFPLSPLEEPSAMDSVRRHLNFDTFHADEQRKEATAANGQDTPISCISFVSQLSQVALPSVPAKGKLTSSEQELIARVQLDQVVVQRQTSSNGDSMSAPPFFRARKLRGVHSNPHHSLRTQVYADALIQPSAFEGGTQLGAQGRSSTIPGVLSVIARSSECTVTIPMCTDRHNHASPSLLDVAASKVMRRSSGCTVASGVCAEKDSEVSLSTSAMHATRQVDVAVSKVMGQSSGYAVSTLLSSDAANDALMASSVMPVVASADTASLKDVRVSTDRDIEAPLAPSAMPIIAQAKAAGAKVTKVFTASIDVSSDTEVSLVPRSCTTLEIQLEAIAGKLSGAAKLRSSGSLMERIAAASRGLSGSQVKRLSATTVVPRTATLQPPATQTLQIGGDVLGASGTSSAAFRTSISTTRPLDDQDQPLNVMSSVTSTVASGAVQQPKQAFLRTHTLPVSSKIAGPLAHSMVPMLASENNEKQVPKRAQLEAVTTAATESTALAALPCASNSVPQTHSIQATSIKDPASAFLPTTLSSSCISGSRGAHDAQTSNLTAQNGILKCLSSLDQVAENLQHTSTKATDMVTTSADIPTTSSHGVQEHNLCYDDRSFDKASAHNHLGAETPTMAPREQHNSYTTWEASLSDADRSMRTSLEPASAQIELGNESGLVTSGSMKSARYRQWGQEPAKQETEHGIPAADAAITQSSPVSSLASMDIDYEALMQSPVENLGESAHRRGTFGKAEGMSMETASFLKKETLTLGKNHESDAVFRCAMWDIERHDPFLPEEAGAVSQDIDAFGSRKGSSGASLTRNTAGRIKRVTSSTVDWHAESHTRSWAVWGDLGTSEESIDLMVQEGSIELLDSPVHIAAVSSQRCGKKRNMDIWGNHVVDRPSLANVADVLSLPVQFPAAATASSPSKVSVQQQPCQRRGKIAMEESSFHTHEHATFAEGKRTALSLNNDRLIPSQLVSARQSGRVLKKVRFMSPVKEVNAVKGYGSAKTGSPAANGERCVKLPGDEFGRFRGQDTDKAMGQEQLMVPLEGVKSSDGQESHKAEVQGALMAPFRDMSNTVGQSPTAKSSCRVLEDIGKASLKQSSGSLLSKSLKDLSLHTTSADALEKPASEQAIGVGGLDSLIEKWLVKPQTTVYSKEMKILELQDLVKFGPLGGAIVPSQLNKADLDVARVIQQIDNKFISAASNGMVLLIDQHAADERIQIEHLTGLVTDKIEQLRAKQQPEQPDPWKVLAVTQPIHVDGDDQAAVEPLAVSQRSSIQQEEHVLSSVRLDLPQVVHLTLAEMRAFCSYESEVLLWGWQGDAVPQTAGAAPTDNRPLGQSLSLTHVPAICGTRLTSTDLKLFLHQLLETRGAHTPPESVLHTLRSKACRSAIMFGDTLSPTQCTSLLSGLCSTSAWHSCAHGRPTAAPLVQVKDLRVAISRFKAYETLTSRVDDLADRRLTKERLQSYLRKKRKRILES